MITDAANAYADALRGKSKQYDEQSKLYAVMYAQSDNKADQAAFKKNVELSEMFQKLHSEACQFLHAIEAEMQQRLTAKPAADNE